MGALLSSVYELRNHLALGGQSLIALNADPRASTNPKKMSNTRLLTLDAKFCHRQGDTEPQAVKMRISHERFTPACVALFESLALGGEL